MFKSKNKDVVQTREDFIMFAICMKKEQRKKKKKNDNNLIEKKENNIRKKTHTRV